jgi:tetratricopeptide (TPR) repeat protein
VKRLAAVAILGAAALLAAAAPARAQSKRYPLEPVDKDQEKLERSKLWESATNPQRTPYDKLIFEAEQALREGTSAAAQEALKKLDDAVKLMADEPKAYRLRGDAAMALKDWPRCAADYGVAWARAAATSSSSSAGASLRAARPARDPLDARQQTDLRRKLGLCQARSGKLADAERTLADAAVSGNATGEIWMRLGEVRIAMGKLEEAIAALESAVEQGDAAPATIRWLLAGAYDRARRPAEAGEAARRAYGLDRSFSTLRNEALPLLGVGEPEYLQGVAYTAIDQPRPDYAVIYFRYFLKIAKDSPWRKRAEEHLRDLRSIELPEAIEKDGGSAPLDAAVALGPVRRAMGGMRACLARTPFIIYKVTITKTGPRTSPGGPDRPRYVVPPETVIVAPSVALPSVGDVPQAERDAAVRCIEPLASKIPFPAIKEKDTYFRLSFFVIAP